MKAISRRELIVRGLMTGGAAMLGGVAAGAQTALASETAVSADDFTWDMEADVVVLGFGAAGIGAAVAASEAGLSVIVLEKMDEANAGGGFSCNGGGLVPNTADLIKFASFNRFSDEFSEDLANREAETCDWLNSIHAGMNAIEFEGINVYAEAGGGFAIYTDIAPQIASYDGVDVEYSMAATGLITDSATGEVLGVRASKDDAEVMVKGKLATVIATGGFAADPALMGDVYGACLPFAQSGTPAATGDGIKMALSIGARMGRFAQSYELYNPALRVASENLGTAVELQTNTANGCIYVNVDGARFCNEAETMTHNKASIPFLDFRSEGLLVKPDMTVGYRNLPAWAIWDSTMFSGDPIVEQGAVSWARSHAGLEWGTDNTAHGEEDGIIVADTLEELAAKMTATDIWGQDLVVDADGLAATIEAYNGYVDAGEDADFGRDASSMSAKIATPPFYAAEIEPNIMFTINGLETDETSQVLGWDGKAIPRLYAAGDAAQGSILATIGFVGTIVRGQIAVEQAASLTAWDK